MAKAIDLTGQRFGRWVVIRFAGTEKWRDARWLCRCDCERKAIVRGSSLRSGTSHQCMQCAKTTHEQTGTHLYRMWEHMIQRCENPNATAYKYYGKRGIKICAEWRKNFTTFRQWALEHGYREDLTIDRIDNDGDYEPGNCQFLTRSENSLKAWHVDGSYGEKYLIASTVE